MKKLLELLGTISLSTIVTTNTIACDINLDESNPQNDLAEKSKNTLHSIKTESQKSKAKVKPKINPSLKEQIKIEDETKTIVKTHAFEEKESTDELLSSTSSDDLKPTSVKTNFIPPKLVYPKQESKLKPTVTSETQTKTVVTSIKTKSQIKPTYFFKDNYGKDYFITEEGLYAANQENDELIKISNTKDHNIWHVTFDSKNNLYFAAYCAEFKDNSYPDPHGEVYVVKNNTTTALKIEGIDKWAHNITVDKHDNVYLDTDNGLYIINEGQTNAVLFTLLETNEFVNVKEQVKKGRLREDYHKNLSDLSGNPIKRIYYRKTLGFDDNNNLYFTTVQTTKVWNWKDKSVKKIENLDSEINMIAINQNYVYFATKLGAYVLKQNETTAVKIEGLDFLGKPNETNYFFIDNNRIYVGCLFYTYILDFDHKIIKLLPFDSQLLRYDNQGNIYFGGGRGLYKFNIATNTYQKIKINKNGRLIDTDDEIKDIYFVKNQMYFEEYTRKSRNFYRITANNIAEPVDKSSIYN